MSNIIKKENNNKSITEKTKNMDIVFQETKEIMANIPALSRLSTALEKPFKVIDKEKMNEIIEKTKEINEKIYVFSKSDTQITRKLMTLSMLYPADSIYRQLQQIAAQIEKKQMALTENQVKLAEQQIEYEELKNKLETETNQIEKLKIEVKIQKLSVGIANSMSYIEAAIKEIGYLLDAYEQIKKNKNIPDDWDEYDFEREEIRTQIKGAFRNGLRDHLVHGRIGMGTCEYFEQFGISYIEAIVEIQKYITECNKKLNNNNIPDFDDLYEWLNKMADKYYNNHKKICKWMGLDADSLISTKYTLLSTRNKKELGIIEKNDKK